MGKYIRKSKTTREVAVSHAQSSLGVRTRAKTLALQRLEKSSAAAAAASTGVAAEGCGDGCYMQLRNRRLEKPAPPESRRQKYPPLEKEPNSNKARVGPNSVENSGKEKENEKKLEEKQDENSVEASFGENVLEFEGKERCSLSL